MQKAEFFRDGSRTWERKIQDGRHFAEFENQTIANGIYDRVIYDLRDQKCIVILFFFILKSL